MLITSLSAMVSVLLFVIVGGLVDGFIGSTLNKLGKFYPQFHFSVVPDTPVSFLPAMALFLHGCVQNAEDTFLSQRQMM